jgi:hypothetical protein
MFFAVLGLGNIIPLDLTAEMAQLGMGISPLLWRSPPRGVGPVDDRRHGATPKQLLRRRAVPHISRCFSVLGL